MSIQLRFSTTRSLVSSLIRAWTWSAFSHVDIIVPGMGYLGSKAPQGVRLRPWDYQKPSRAMIGTVECTEAQAADVMEFALRQVGKKYDWLNIYGEILHKDWTEEPNRWVCSALIWAAFHYAGIDLVDPEKLDRLTPKDLLLSPYITLRELL